MSLLYHSDDDLTDVRPNIFDYGVTDFEAQMLEAERVINRTLDARWYRNVALNSGLDWRATPFDPTLLLNVEQVKKLAVYKSLQLIYIHLMKETRDPDVFERQAETFYKMYKDELQEVLNAGIDYDWDESGEVEAEESLKPRVRRLYRV